MKRRPFQSISTVLLGVGTLIGSLCTAPLTYAHDVAASGVDANLLPIGTEINGKRYWSVSEMLTASELINAKRKEFCAGDSMCEMDLSFEQAEHFGGIYRALESFDQMRFMLTSINPSLGTMKLLFRDEDKMMSRMEGRTIRHHIDSIYTVWVEESLGDPSMDARWLAYGYRYPFHLGATEEEARAASHVIMDESSDTLDVGWFTPNMEREYDIKDSQIENNTSGLIFFSYQSSGGSSHGTLGYRECIDSPDYREGMECKMMYQDEGYFEMLPMEPIEEPASEIVDEVTESTAESTSEHPTSGLAEASDATLVVASDTVPTSTQTALSNAPKAPDTSAPSDSEQNGEQIAKSSDGAVGLSLSATPSGEGPISVFPWWLIGLMFFGGLFFLFSIWLLLPLFWQRIVNKS